MLQVSSHLPHTTVRNPVETPGHVSPVSDLRLREPNLCRPLVQDEIHPPSPLTLLSSHVRKTQKYPIPTPHPTIPHPWSCLPPGWESAQPPGCPEQTLRAEGWGKGGEAGTGRRQNTGRVTRRQEVWKEARGWQGCPKHPCGPRSHLVRDGLLTPLPRDHLAQTDASPDAIHPDGCPPTGPPDSRTQGLPRFVPLTLDCRSRDISPFDHTQPAV